MAGRDQSAADQPNNLAGHHDPRWVTLLKRKIEQVNTSYTARTASNAHVLRKEAQTSLGELHNATFPDPVSTAWPFDLKPIFIFSLLNTTR